MVTTTPAKLPEHTPRVRFRHMTDADLSYMTPLLGDPQVMEYYPAPKTADEARAWIEWNQHNYADFGFGLWIIETRGGEFIGDCGLTWQNVNGEERLEVGYHVLPQSQGKGLATEAARACIDFAREALGAHEVVAIIHPENLASRRVAEKVGMSEETFDHSKNIERVVMQMPLASSFS